MQVVIQCKDQVGLVSTISTIVAREGLNIVSMLEHVDKMEDRFFMRLELEKDADAPALEKNLLDRLPSGAVVMVNPMPEKKIIVMVSKEYHCLSDILIRHAFKTLGAHVQAVIGNHEVLRDICLRFDIPFFLIPHEQSEHEAALMEILAMQKPDFIVLAKFMRILSPQMVAAFPSRIINIHHSFLPAFAGANPYRQAFERGVKLIGATAHFVTDVLDEGPIIAQQIIPVNHSHSPADMVRAGKEIETAVLARALRFVFEDRVIVYKNKTVVFE